MLQLSPDECRVLGVLVEKAQTTPDQYPLTLNALVAGDSSLYMIIACNINAAGEITGLAFDTSSNELHGFLASPSTAVPAGSLSQGTNRPAVLSDDHRRLILQGLNSWRLGAFLAPRR